MSDTLTDPLLGRLVDGRYEVRERVANGGMATVYVAFDKRLEREVALKVMHPEDDATARELVSRFRREAKAAARLTHPGIVHVYDQGVDHDLSYLTMEYVAGENLRQRIAHEGTLSVGEALGITESILDALASAHRLGIVHRDVKPENVLIDADGRPRVADFGLARAITEATSPTTGMIMGTVGYLAPELIALGVADARSDVYSAGVLLFEMVTGRQPFAGGDMLAVAARHVHEDVPSPSTFAPWLPTEFDDLVAELTARTPDERAADGAAALALVRSTRARMDDPTLDRRADPPSGTFARVTDADATTVLDAAPVGATIALPIGLATNFAPVEAFHAELTEGDPEALEPMPTRQRGWWWVASIVAVLVLVGAAALWWYNAVGPGAYTTVPDVNQWLEQDAKDTLESLDFEVATTTAFHDDVPEGAVINTDPEALTRVEKASLVTLVVSLGPRMETVPTVVGNQEDAAREALEALNFPIGESERVYSDTVPKGEVTAIDPGEGESVRHDTTITLTVSDGPQPIVIPGVVGMTEEEALAEADKYKLDVNIERERTEEAPKGEVFRQDPEADADGFRTQAITLWVSEGPPLVTVDDYVGMDVEAAEAAATEDGLKVRLYGYWWWSDPNVVVGQDLGPNQEVEKGSTITLQYN